VSAATRVLAAVREAGVTLGGRCRVVTVDGPAGSGKTTLAGAVLAEAARAEWPDVVEVVHMDDLYDGWRGVLTVADQVHDLVCALRDHGAAAYRRYDWHRAAYAEERRLLLPDLLVLEGVGSSAAACDELVAVHVWVEAPRELRLARGLERDGQVLRAQWLRFVSDEEAVHRRERTRERAHLVVDGVTGAVRPGARDLRGPR
jgi:uridine kinase